MSKFFPASTRHVKVQEFLDLRQGDMTVLEYVVRFTELAHFADDYVATDLAKIRRFKDSLGQHYGTSPVGYGLYG